MAKRQATPGEESPYTKRRKLQGEESAGDKDFDIKSPKELRDLLFFDQDATCEEAKRKVKAFKSFLANIRSNTDSNESDNNRAILLNFCQTKWPKAGSTDATAFSSLVQSWHFAVQASSEALCSSIAGVFALLLKTVSSILDFREHGISLCYDLLKAENLTLLDLGLTANQAKEYMIDPCLRLLTEMVRFDGGRAAKIVYRQRETTFRRLDIFLGMQRRQNESDRNARRPTLRNAAVQFILANLQLQGAAEKAFLLKQSHMMHSLLQGIVWDSPWMIREILRVLKNDVLEDSVLSHSDKHQFLTESAFRNLVKLYDCNEEIPNSSHLSVREMVNSFLLRTCVSLVSEILKKSTPGEPLSSDMFAGLAADHGTIRKRYGGNGAPKSIKSITALLGQLRPHADVLQGELVLEVFRVYPPLLHDYYSGKNAFPFTPRLSATWVGYSRFILATVQLPVDVKLLKGMYLQSNVLRQHLSSCILPPVLDHKTLARCLNSPCNLIVFITARIMNAAFQKLNHVLALLDVNSRDPVFERLKNDISIELASRYPGMQQVIAKFRGCHSGNITMKESLTRLLAMYYQNLPDIALEQTFDISSEVSCALDTSTCADPDSSDDKIKCLTLDHLLQIAIWSPTMRWWHKSGNLVTSSISEEKRLSPFTTLLRFLASQSDLDGYSHVKNGLSSIAKEYAITTSTGQTDGLQILIFSLRCVESNDPAELYEFLDQCIVRVAKQAVVVLEQAHAKGSMTMEIDLLLLALAQQWPFLVQSKTPSVVKNIASWLHTYLRLTAQAGSDLTVLSILHKQVMATITHEGCRAALEHSLDPPLDTGTELKLKPTRQPAPPQFNDSPEHNAPAEDEVLRGGSPPKEKSEHTELHSWKRENLHDAAINGLLGDLVLCLSSGDVAIRRESLCNIRSLMQKLEVSTYPERSQLYVLLGEACETAQCVATNEALPYVASVLAAKLLPVLTDPLHHMYVKASEFLHKGPRWDVSKLPSYWVSKVVQCEPASEEDYYAELAWVLDYLIDGLRSSTDMEIYRRSNVLERILAMPWSPALPPGPVEKIVDLLVRCTHVEGSTTLVTRCGLGSWIACRLPNANNCVRKRLKQLAKKLMENSDKVRVEEWNEGTLNTLEELSADLKSSTMSVKV